MSNENKSASDTLEVVFSRRIVKEFLPDIGKIIGKPLLKENILSCRTESKREGDTKKADIHIKTTDNKAIIIENQHNHSDHDHLGKIFTYTAELEEEDYHITDAVWIMIDGKGNVCKEHFRAANFINSICEKKGIEYKIWLLVVDESNDGLRLRQAAPEDLWESGTAPKVPLIEFLSRFRNAIICDKRFDLNPDNGRGNSFGIARGAKGYDINIAFRETWLTVEAKFNKRWKDHFKEQISENFAVDINEWSKDYVMKEKIKGYSIRWEYPKGTTKYIKICGEFEADKDNKKKWDEYLQHALDLLELVVGFSDYEFDKHRP